MKILITLCALVSAAALTVAPFSVELSSSLFVAAGLLGLVSREYATERRPIGPDA
jgi:hypothetical protein